MRLESIKSFLIVFILFFFLGTGPQHAQSLTGIMSPEKFFGFKPGADRMLFDYEQLVDYLQKLDAVSPRLKLVEIGESPRGKKMYIAFISSEANIENLEKLKEISRRLTLEPDMPEQERAAVIEAGKVFFLATLSMHSEEVGPSQAAPLIAYELVTSKDPQTLAALDNVVYMMVPNHNPDGMDMVVNHYKKYKGTRYEGSSMPGVYHQYVGHDNNRDFVTLTQKDTRVISRIYSQEWFPQVMVEKHQMGTDTARYFVPPYHDPVAENVEAGIWNWIGIFGANMIKDMTLQGLSGVAQGYIFDNYWPGSTETCIWKNVIGLLTEAASVKYAVPVFVEPNELEAYGKGLAEYKKSTKMPLPWPGGWWRLSDIVQYEVVSTMSMIRTAARHRQDILQFRSQLCKREVLLGRTRPPFHYILPLDQHDQSELVELVNLLKEHGVEVYRLSADIVIDEQNFKAGDIVVPLSQPFRPFIKEVMERQEYPLRHYTRGGKIIKPYDITSWSLALHLGLKAVEINSQVLDLDAKLEKIAGPFKLVKDIPQDFWAAFLPVNRNESFKILFLALHSGLKVDRLEDGIKVDGQDVPAGSFVVYHDGGNSSKIRGLLSKLQVSPHFARTSLELKVRHLQLPRIALVETIFHDMDAGWTRYLFDTYSIPYRVIAPADFEKTDFVKDFDVVVFADVSDSLLSSGKWEYQGRFYISDYPPQFTKGLGKKGMEKLMAWFADGGIIVSWGASTGLFLKDLAIPAGKDEKEEFQLPVRDISKELEKAGLYCPGSFLKINLLPHHAITLGMEKQGGILFNNGPIFETWLPDFDMDRRVIAKFPEKDILLSGYCEKEEKLGNRTVMVWVRKGKGQMVLLGFSPQFRASTPVTYKLLFNSLLLPRIK